MGRIPWGDQLRQSRSTQRQRWWNFYRMLPRQRFVFLCCGIVNVRPPGAHGASWFRLLRRTRPWARATALGLRRGWRKLPPEPGFKPTTYHRSRASVFTTVSRHLKSSLWPLPTKGALSRWGQYELQAKKWRAITWLCPLLDCPTLTFSVVVVFKYRLGSNVAFGVYFLAVPISQKLIKSTL